MALAFRTVKLKVPRQSISKPATDEQSFEFHSPICRDDRDHRIWAVSLQSYEFTAYHGGREEDWELGKQSIKLRLDPDDYQSGKVVAEFYMTGRPDVRNDSAYEFSAEATVLITADLEIGRT